MKGTFDNTFKLTRFLLRRERITSLIWIAAIVLCTAGLSPFLENMFMGEDMGAIKEVIENPALISMIGPYVGGINDTFGAMFSNFMLVFLVLTVGIMNIFLVVRHTRADEEQWRYEVVRSLPTGRLANLSAVMLMAVILNTVLAVLLGFGLFVLGDGESMTLGGSMLWGFANGAGGLVFAAIAALFAQLANNSRSAIAYSFVVMILFYLLRGLGDMQTTATWSDALAAGEVPSMSILALLTPFGLAVRTYAYAGDYWWPVFIMLGMAIAIAALAFFFNAKRDIDQGIIPVRPGKRNGGILMRSHVGLSIRLTRTLLIGWGVLMLGLGASYASILGDIGGFIAENDMYRDLLLGPTGIEFVTDDATGQITATLHGAFFRAVDGSDGILELMNEVVAYAGFTVQDLFASMIMNLMALVSAVPVLIFIMKVKGEERDIRAELLVAAPVNKVRYLLSYTVIGMVAAVIMQLVLVLGLYGVGITTVDPEVLSLSFLLEAGLAYVPAMWAMGGVMVVLVGLIPKVTGFIWAFYAYSFIAVFLGRMPGMPRGFGYLAPIAFAPQLPMEEINWLTMAVLTAIAAGLTAIGLWGYRRRDINAITN